MVIKVIFYTSMFIFLSILTGECQSSGRIAVILDNSGSMNKAGSSFHSIKLSLINYLDLFPKYYEIGLRVFDNKSSHLIVPYQSSVGDMKTTLMTILPDSGTYIGPSLLDAAGDLLEASRDYYRIILITDGEGAFGDIEKAHQARERLKSLTGDFKCYIILFSSKRDVREQTPIGRVAEALGCALDVPGASASAWGVSKAFQRIMSRDIDMLWVLISAIGYLALSVFASGLVFSTQFTQGVLPRNARWIALGVLVLLVVVIVNVHFVGLVSSFFVWLFLLCALLLLFFGILGVGQSSFGRQRQGNDDDPFAL